MSAQKMEVRCFSETSVPLCHVMWLHIPEYLNLHIHRNEDQLCSLVVRVPGYRTEMYCASCEVRTEFIPVMQKKVYRLCGLVVRVPGYRSRGPGSIPGSTRFSEK
jgi:hypothetical protein